MKNILGIRTKQPGATIRRIAGAACVLVMVAGAMMTVHRLLPKSPPGGNSHPSRAGWYLRGGQWQADLRTLVAVVEYVMAPEQSVMARQCPTNNGPVATAPATGTRAARHAVVQPGHTLCTTEGGWRLFWMRVRFRSTVEE